MQLFGVLRKDQLAVPVVGFIQYVVGQQFELLVEDRLGLHVETGFHRAWVAGLAAEFHDDMRLEELLDFVRLAVKFFGLGPRNGLVKLFVGSPGFLQRGLYALQMGISIFYPHQGFGREIGKEADPLLHFDALLHVRHDHHFRMALDR